MVDYAETVTEFRAGRVITRTFGTFFRNILPFGLIALAVTSPSYIYALLAGVDPLADPVESMEYASGAIAENVILSIVQILLSYLVTAALVYGTIQSLRNNPASVGECVSRGLGSMFPALGIAIVSGILTMLAFLALVIPGFWVMTVLWVAVPVAVIERRGMGSLSRSAALTKGSRWRIFFLFLILLAIMMGIGGVVGGIAGALAYSAISSGADISPGMVTTIIGVDWVFSALISALSAVLIAVSYHDLRVAKEGADTDQIAAVFD